ncbi:MAG: thiol:disulfide interchange protein DsbG [Mixta calida]|uniref:thiol:disulfide interchange protein DsbG n=1 Tax=Mixta calida TaxID=665913 RepID=UPI002900F580|nr:thiol:disulfide interchange protein DsbG [Mixta calida]MDU3074765.1 thiol:disulfide interchange protein DsbG [Mixta calida]MDU6414610.1 thiol:disulfide interchange protein DsbG [Mixta calida]
MNIFKLIVPVLAFSTFAVAASDEPEAIKQMEKQGIRIIGPVDVPGGLKGWLGDYQGAGVTLYLTPDGKHVISGYMYDEKGKNLSESLINEKIYVPAGREMWKKLQSVPGVTEGSDKAGCHVVVFADPFCPYCRTFYQQVEPAIRNNSLQIKTLLVGILKPESGQYAAGILSAANPSQAWRDFENSPGITKPDLPEKTPRHIFDQIQNNQNLMQELGANGTPAIYYMSSDKKLQQVIGLPNKEQMADLQKCHQ